MTAPAPRLVVHVDRVILHGVPALAPEALAAAIETALVESLAPPAAGAPQDPRPQPVGAHVGRAVAPAVLGAAGMTPGGRP